MQQPNRDKDAENSGIIPLVSSSARNNVGEGEYSMLQQQQWHPQLLHAFPPSMIARPGMNQPEYVALNAAANLQRRHEQQSMSSQALNASQLSDLVRNLQQSVPNSTLNGSAAQYLLASSQGSEELKLQQLISEQLQRLVTTTTNVNPSMYSSTNREVQQASSSSAAPKHNPQFPVVPAPKNAMNISSSQLLLPPAIIPCRARGMPCEHDSKSAYFVMPNGIEHGGDLVCSFSACRNEGIKFCYCSHCGIPVAKRNFRQRHAHESQTKKQAKAAPQATSRNSLPVQSQSSNSAAPRSQSKLPPPTPGLKSPTFKEDHCPKEQEDSGTSTNSFIDTDQSCNAHKQPKPMSSLVFSSKDGQVEIGGSDAAVSSSLNHKQQRRWASLLRQRPPDKNGDEMSAWLQSVIEISDPLSRLVDSAESTVGDAANINQTLMTTTPVGAPANGATDNTNGSVESAPSEGDGSSGSTDDSSSSQAEGSSSDYNSDDDYTKNFVAEAELTMHGSNSNPRGVCSGGSGSAESSTPAHVSGAVDTIETGHHARSSGNNEESRDAKKRRLAPDDAAILRGN